MNADQEHMPHVIDLSSLLQAYANKWVVLSEDKTSVIASGNTLEELAGKIHEGIVMRVPEFSMAYAPTTTR